MEPFDIDKIIREKLSESHDLHLDEMESSKPFVWSAVQKKTDVRRPLTWFHLAAAVLFLMLSYSFVLFSIQEKHNDEMGLLSEKMKQLEQNYIARAEQLEAKNIQVNTLEGEMKLIKAKFANNQQVPQQVWEKPKPEKTQMVYLTDTVYIKQIEYITTIVDPSHSEEPMLENRAPDPERIETNLAQNSKTDDIIFPSLQSRSKNQNSESVKFRIGTTVVKSN